MKMSMKEYECVDISIREALRRDSPEYWWPSLHLATNDSFPDYGLAKNLDIEDQSKILYAPTGAGEWLVALKRDLPDAEIVALDFCEQMIRLVKKKVEVPKILSLSLVKEYVMRNRMREEYGPLKYFYENLSTMSKQEILSRVDKLIGKFYHLKIPALDKALENWNSTEFETRGKNLELCVMDANWLPFPDDTFDIAISYESVRGLFDQVHGIPFLQMLRTSDKVILIPDPSFIFGSPWEAREKGVFERDFSFGSGGPNPVPFVRELLKNLCTVYDISREDKTFEQDVYYGWGLENSLKNTFHTITLRKSSLSKRMISQDLDFIRLLLDGLDVTAIKQIYGFSKTDETLERLTLLTKSGREYMRNVILRMLY